MSVGHPTRFEERRAKRDPNEAKQELGSELESDELSAVTRL